MIITNNPSVITKFSNHYHIINLYGKNYLDILLKARDFVHKGHTLLTHPLSGSIKPNETPFKSIVLTLQSTSFDFKSLEIIESSILTTKKLLQDSRTPIYSEKIIDDFALIDFNLIKSGIESIIQFSNPII
ncbi:GrdX family protein [Cetobacterium sp. SF1]|uniref:GrdX family protein n=1 Tax=unclassified Cetobacterium TaxID=2630983 RepID=UPI003CF34F40